MKPNSESFQANSETLLITRQLMRRVRKLRKKDLTRANAARPAKRFLEDLRMLGMEFPGAAFEEPPCADCLDTSLWIAEGSLLEFEHMLLSEGLTPAPGVH